MTTAQKAGNLTVLEGAHLYTEVLSNGAIHVHTSTNCMFTF